MPREFYSAGEAARTLGISLDTLRRWDSQGRIKTRRDRSNRRIVSAKEIDRLRGDARPEHHVSARNRLSGIVSEVQGRRADGAGRAGDHRAGRADRDRHRRCRRRTGDQARQPHRRGRQVHLGHGRALERGRSSASRSEVRRFTDARLLVARRRSPSATRQAGARKVTGITVYAAASLTDVFPKIDSGPKYSFGARTRSPRRSPSARRRTCSRPRTRRPGAAVREGPRAEAGRLHA